MASNPNADHQHLIQARLNLIWQMGEASLTSTGNEIRIPLNLSQQLQDFEIAEIKRRLGQKFNGALTVHFKDFQLEVLRIFALPNSPAATNTPENSVVSSEASSPPNTSMSAADDAEKLQNSSSSRKHKIPRPPNAFILYRQQWHPKIKEKNPTMHNNDISVLLGKQWKSESQSVKQSFKELAENIKLQHAAENPGYQYTPRKPAEKKRRMTARKLARMQEKYLDQITSSPYAYVQGLTAAQPEHADIRGIGGSSLDQQAPLPSLDDLLGIQAPTYQNQNQTANTSQMHITLPVNNDQNGNEHNLWAAQTQPLQPAASTQPEIATSTPAHVEATEEFLNSLVDYEAFQSIEFLETADMRTMTSIDEVDCNLPHLQPFDHAEFSAYQDQLDDILDLFI